MKRITCPVRTRSACRERHGPIRYAVILGRCRDEPEAEVMGTGPVALYDLEISESGARGLES